jgi:hypothetical protein
MSDNREFCIDCAAPTGNAGKHDGSLYLDSGSGPYCLECWQPIRIEELDKRVAELEGDVYTQAKAKHEAYITIDSWEEKHKAVEAKLEAAEARIAEVRKVRDALATQCLNDHAVKMLDKALQEKPHE